jgi:hypothetical protein
MTPALELVWTFTPENYFEEVFNVSLSGCEIAVQSGKVTATIDRAALDLKRTLRVEVEAYVSNMFLGVQLQSHVAHTLSGPAVTNIGADGSRGYVIECKVGEFKIRGHQVDLRYTRADGSVCDTKLERLQQKRFFAQLSAKIAPTDEILARALHSYGAAVRDQEDELVHLYEIRDALAKRFGGEHKAKRQLGIPQTQWSRFGQLCNELPLSQGRHRGKSEGALRPASEEELVEARSFITCLIKAYLDHVETPGVDLGLGGQPKPSRAATLQVRPTDNHAILA